MHEHTAALPLFEPEGFAPVIGTEIEGALRGGCVNGVRWEIEGYTREMLVQLPGIKLYYTGGVPLIFAPEIETIKLYFAVLSIISFSGTYTDNCTHTMIVNTPAPKRALSMGIAVSINA